MFFIPQKVKQKVKKLTARVYIGSELMNFYIAQN